MSNRLPDTGGVGGEGGEDVVPQTTLHFRRTECLDGMWVDRFPLSPFLLSFYSSRIWEGIR